MSDIEKYNPNSTVLYRSLLSWINSFDNIKPKITSLTDLSDSRIFVECVRKATPIRRTQSFQHSSIVQKIQFDSPPGEDHESNFSEVVLIFSEFFGFALDKAIFIRELLTRSESEFIKLVLVFLAYALQQKPNELIIQKILSLENEVQVTLRKLIEEMFQKLGSKQSDIIQDLIIESDLDFSETQNEVIDNSDEMIDLPENPELATPPLRSPEPSPAEIPPADKLIIEPISSPFNSPVQNTTSQEEIQFGVTCRYYGFDSPAALKWINKPELRRIKRQDSSRPTPPKVHELRQLQYMVNQQQEEIHSLKRFCQECENELADSGNRCRILESECTTLRLERESTRDLEDEKKALHEQNQTFERENKSLKQEVSALSEYRDKCSRLQNMAEELASTAKGNQLLLLSAEKLQLELTTEKDTCFNLQSEKASLERASLEQQATIQVLEQGKEELRGELEVMRNRADHLHADLRQLKEGEIKDIKLDEKESESMRSDEFALLFKIKLLEDKIHELRKLIPVAAERDAIQVELQRTTKELDAMRESNQELTKLFSEVKTCNLRLEGKLVDFENCKSKLDSAKEDLTSLQKENSSLSLELQSNSSTHRTISTEKDRLQLCLDQSEREKAMLKRRATELDATVISVQETYNELFALKHKLVLDNDNLEKELMEIKVNKSLLQDRETRTATELNAVISQRTEEQTELNAKLAALQETNCTLENGLRNIQMKVYTATSECALKEEVISSLSESSRKKELDLSEALESAKSRNDELQSEVNQVKCEYATIQGQLEILTKRYERKAEELENETKDFKKCQKELELKLEQAGNQFADRKSALQGHVCSLEENVQALAHDNQSLQQEKQRLTAIVKEYESMEAETNLRVREELDEKKNRVWMLEEKLDDIENERNSLHSQVRSLNVQLQFAETQLMEKNKSDANKFSRASHRTESITVPTIKRPDFEFTNINNSSSQHAIPAPRSNWRDSVETNYSQPTSRSSSRAALYSSAIEPESSVSSITPANMPDTSIYRTDEIKRRNAQNLPHLKSSYPVEFQTTSVSERYLQSQNRDADVNPRYQPSKMSQTHPNVSFIADNPPKRKALAFEVDVGVPEAPKVKKEKDNAAQQPRMLRSHRTRPATVLPTSTSTNKKKRT